MVTVKQLIEHLKTFDENLPVAYQLHSEYNSLELEEVKIEKLHPARADGWIHDYFPQESKEEKEKRIEYLTFPGN